MRYAVLLHRYSTGVYEAVAPAVPGCTGKGKTQREALSQLKSMLQSWLETTEITTIDVDLPKTDQRHTLNPWLATAGMFEDAPMLESMLNETTLKTFQDSESGKNMKTCAILDELYQDLGRERQC